MITTLNAVLLPDSFFPEAVHLYSNPTSDIKLVKINMRKAGVDESIHQYINNPSNKIHVASHLKKIIQVEAELVSSDKELDVAKFIVPIKKDFKSIRAITVEHLLLSQIPVNLRNLLMDKIDWDLIDKEDYVIMPVQKYTWQSNTNSQWYTERPILTGIDHHAESILSSRDVTVFDYLSLINCSNNRPMSEEELYKIKKLLSIEDTKQLALDVMNVLNPVTSFIELMIAFNTIPDEMKKKNKPKILPLMQELYNIDVTHASYSLQQILDLYERFFGMKPSQEQLEFICDHYDSRYVEKSSIFEFKLKLKD